MILAHGIGGRSDLPVPLWLALYAGAAAVLVSFVAVSLLWTRPRLRGAAAGLSLPHPVQTAVDSSVTRWILRIVGLAAFASTLAVAWYGAVSSSENPAPTWFYVWFWLGVPAASLLFGPVYRTLNPLRTIASAVRRIARLGEPTALDPTRFPFAPLVGLTAFLWLELVYTESDAPRTVATFISGYAVLTIAAGVRFGDSWFDRGDGFEVYFGLVARLAPFGRREDGRLVVRNPLDGLVAGDVGVLTPVVLLLLGATTFDGVTRLPFWSDLRDGLAAPAAMALGTAGLATTVALVVAGYAGAIQLTKPYLRKDAGNPYQAFGHSLIPIMVGYAVAHYFSFTVFQGQAGFLLATDPFGTGTDLFGLGSARIDYTVVSTTVIAFVQIGGIICGHILGVVSAHDRAVAILRPGYVKVGQFPMLALMVVYTMVGIQLVSSS